MALGPGVLRGQRLNSLPALISPREKRTRLAGMLLARDLVLLLVLLGELFFAS